MTTVTTPMMYVPVRTWREKAILAAAIASPLSGFWEAFDCHAGFIHDHLAAPGATDDLLDGYFGSRPELELVEGLLRTLRSTVPGPESMLEVPGEFDLVQELSDEVAHLASQDVEDRAPGRREAAKATIVAVDLLAEVETIRAAAGGDA
jgi:hypothetical protein